LHVFIAGIHLFHGGLEMARDLARVKKTGLTIRKNLTAYQRGPFPQEGGVIRRVFALVFLLFLFVAALPFPGYPAEPTYPINADVRTTRDRTVRPVAIPGAPEITIERVDKYNDYGYSHWEFGAPVDYGLLLPDSTVPVTPTAVETLLTFFSISDIHITDKESPAQLLYSGVTGTFGDTDTSAYSPVILSTTHVLDAAVQTINVLHNQTPFDFGISLGDDANSNLYNELRWFIDVMDGKRITPSTGAHKGAGSIDYQMPYQSAGLDRSIPWYAVLGNHDQYWSGILYPIDYVRTILVGNTVIDMGRGPTGFHTFDARGTYMGVVDGTTQYGTVIDDGHADTMATPIVAADHSRRALSKDTSTSLNWMKEFFNTTSKPKGHGFTQANIYQDFASHTFEPKTSVPVKVIVLDDTCKQNPYVSSGQHNSYARGCLDQTRYDWLLNELDQGQAEGKLMIIAAHLPVGPQLDVPDAPVPAGGHANSTVETMFLSTCKGGSKPIGTPCDLGANIADNDPVPPYTVVTDASLLATLHNYPNVILWMAGHRHINTVTPQPAPAGKGPEFGFWEVETASLRDFPQGFRTFEIVRNSNNTVSIRITNVDPAVQDTGSPAEKSRGYGIGAHRIKAGTAYDGLTDTTSHVYNAELIKPLAAPYHITVNVTGTGTVKMGPYQADTCTASHSCSANYLPGTQVTLAATPTSASGAVFAGWSTCPGTSTCNIAMTGDVTITATFTKEPTVVVTPAYKNFRNVKIGRKAVATLTIKNATTKGVADLIMGTIVPGQSDSGQFAVVTGKDLCSGKTIKPGKSCTFQVSFLPSLSNTRAGTISIPSNDPSTPMTIQLTGVGK
jgi:hypothetical protein